MARTKQTRRGKKKRKTAEKMETYPQASHQDGVPCPLCGARYTRGQLRFLAAALKKSLNKKGWISFKKSGTGCPTCSPFKISELGQLKNSKPSKVVKAQHVHVDPPGHRVLQIKSYDEHYWGVHANVQNEPPWIVAELENAGQWQDLGIEKKWIIHKYNDTIVNRENSSILRAHLLSGKACTIDFALPQVGVTGTREVEQKSSTIEDSNTAGRNAEIQDGSPMSATASETATGQVDTVSKTVRKPDADVNMELFDVDEIGDVQASVKVPTAAVTPTQLGLVTEPLDKTLESNQIEEEKTNKSKEARGVSKASESSPRTSNQKRLFSELDITRKEAATPRKKRKLSPPQQNLLEKEDELEVCGYCHAEEKILKQSKTNDLLQVCFWCAFFEDRHGKLIPVSEREKPSLKKHNKMEKIYVEVSVPSWPNPRKFKIPAHATIASLLKKVTQQCAGHPDYIFKFGTKLTLNGRLVSFDFGSSIEKLLTDNKVNVVYGKDVAKVEYPQIVVELKPTAFIDGGRPDSFNFEWSDDLGTVIHKANQNFRTKPTDCGRRLRIVDEMGNDIFTFEIEKRIYSENIMELLKKLEIDIEKQHYPHRLVFKAHTSDASISSRDTASRRSCSRSYSKSASPQPSRPLSQFEARLVDYGSKLKETWGKKLDIRALIEESPEHEDGYWKMLSGQMNPTTLIANFTTEGAPDVKRFDAFFGPVLLQVLKQFDSTASKELYFSDNSWDIGGLEHDLKIVQEEVEAIKLLKKLQSLDPRAKKCDFFNSDTAEWDKAGIESDYNITLFEELRKLNSSVKKDDYCVGQVYKTSLLENAITLAKKQQAIICFEKLRALDPETVREHYCDSHNGEWDDAGLQSDLGITFFDELQKMDPKATEDDYLVEDVWNTTKLECDVLAKFEERIMNLHTKMTLSRLKHLDIGSLAAKFPGQKTNYRKIASGKASDVDTLKGMFIVNGIPQFQQFNIIFDALTAIEKKEVEMIDPYHFDTEAVIDWFKTLSRASENLIFVNDIAKQVRRHNIVGSTLLFLQNKKLKTKLGLRQCPKMWKQLVKGRNKLRKISTMWKNCDPKLKALLSNRLRPGRYIITQSTKVTVDKKENSERKYGLIPGQIVNIVQVEVVSNFVRGKLETGGWVSIQSAQQCNQVWAKINTNESIRQKKRSKRKRKSRKRKNAKKKASKKKKASTKKASKKKASKKKASSKQQEKNKIVKVANFLYGLRPQLAKLADKEKKLSFILKHMQEHFQLDVAEAKRLYLEARKQYGKEVGKEESELLQSGDVTDPEMSNENTNNKYCSAEKLSNEADSPLAGERPKSFAAYLDAVTRLSSTPPDHFHEDTIFKCLTPQKDISMISRCVQSMQRTERKDYEMKVQYEQSCTGYVSYGSSDHRAEHLNVRNLHGAVSNLSYSEKMSELEICEKEAALPRKREKVTQKEEVDSRALTPQNPLQHHEVVVDVKEIPEKVNEPKLQVPHPRSSPLSKSLNENVMQSSPSPPKVLEKQCLMASPRQGEIQSSHEVSNKSELEICQEEVVLPKKREEGTGGKDLNSKAPQKILDSNPTKVMKPELPVAQPLSNTPHSKNVSDNVMQRSPSPPEVLKKEIPKKSSAQEASQNAEEKDNTTYDLGEYEIVHVASITLSKAIDSMEVSRGKLEPGEIVNIVKVKLVSDRVRGRLDTGGWISIESTCQSDKLVWARKKTDYFEKEKYEIVRTVDITESEDLHSKPFFHELKRLKPGQTVSIVKVKVVSDHVRGQLDVGGWISIRSICMKIIWAKRRGKKFEPGYYEIVKTARILASANPYSIVMYSKSNKLNSLKPGQVVRIVKVKIVSDRAVGKLERRGWISIASTCKKQEIWAKWKANIESSVEKTTNTPKSRRPISSRRSSRSSSSRRSRSQTISSSSSARRSRPRSPRKVFRTRSRSFSPKRSRSRRRKRYSRSYSRSPEKTNQMDYYSCSPISDRWHPEKQKSEAMTITNSPAIIEKRSEGYQVSTPASIRNLEPNHPKTISSPTMTPKKIHGHGTGLPTRASMPTPKANNPETPPTSIPRLTQEQNNERFRKVLSRQPITSEPKVSSKSEATEQGMAICTNESLSPSPMPATIPSKPFWEGNIYESDACQFGIYLKLLSGEHAITDLALENGADLTSKGRIKYGTLASYLPAMKKSTRKHIFLVEIHALNGVDWWHYIKFRECYQKLHRGAVLTSKGKAFAIYVIPDTADVPQSLISAVRTTFDCYPPKQVMWGVVVQFPQVTECSTKDNAKPSANEIQTTVITVNTDPRKAEQFGNVINVDELFDVDEIDDTQPSVKVPTAATPTQLALVTELLDKALESNQIEEDKTNDVPMEIQTEYEASVSLEKQESSSVIAASVDTSDLVDPLEQEQRVPPPPPPLYRILGSTLHLESREPKALKISANFIYSIAPQKTIQPTSQSAALQEDMQPSASIQPIELNFQNTAKLPDNVKARYENNYGGVAILYHNGLVKCEGNEEFGGNAFDKQKDLTDVVSIAHTDRAFAALKSDGSVIVWGDAYWGGCAGLKQSKLVDIDSISSTSGAFAALKKRIGIVIVWGSKHRGGDAGPKQSELLDVMCICSTDRAFCATTLSGKIICWGDTHAGGETGPKQLELFNVQSIMSSKRAFAAHRWDGKVVVWGSPLFGGNAGSKQSMLNNIQSLRATEKAFAALKTDGTVVVWGDRNSGGDAEAKQADLVDIVSIAATSHSFAALKKNGSVVAWGHPDFGGEPASKQALLVNIASLEATPSMLIARTKEGRAIHWGPAKNDALEVHFNKLLNQERSTRSLSEQKNEFLGTTLEDWIAKYKDAETQMNVHKAQTEELRNLLLEQRRKLRNNSIAQNHDEIVQLKSQVKELKSRLEESKNIAELENRVVNLSSQVRIQKETETRLRQVVKELQLGANRYMREELVYNKKCKQKLQKENLELKRRLQAFEGKTSASREPISPLGTGATASTNTSTIVQKESTKVSLSKRSSGWYEKDSSGYLGVTSGSGNEFVCLGMINGKQTVLASDFNQQKCAEKAQKKVAKLRVLGYTVPEPYGDPKSRLYKRVISTFSISRHQR